MRTVICISFLLAASVEAQDLEFVRRWEELQKSRPANITSSSRIASVSEPGTPLVVNGRVFRADGVTPARDIIVFAYHTDKRGEYDFGGGRGWRLHGWAKTDKDGRFQFATTRPAPYPSRNTPAHIHLTIEGPGVSRRWVPDIEFENDLYLSAAERNKSKAAGKFGSVRPVAFRSGVQYVDFNIRITDEGKF
jgi:protocatechuate 3,4-dioxygenase beta subunit